MDWTRQTADTLVANTLYLRDLESMGEGSIVA